MDVHHRCRLSAEIAAFPPIRGRNPMKDTGKLPLPEALLTVRDLSVTFHQGGRATPAVRNVSFELYPGETLAIVGESGSGKSVTALSTVRLLPDNAEITGSIRYRGTEMLTADERTLRRTRGNDISFIFQEPMTSLNPLHTIEKQLAESLALHQGLTGAPARARILDLLARVGIRDPEERLAAYPHQLSGGQRQRVMIAMALANGPDILIADEPTTALDVTVQARILDLLAEVQKAEGMGMLFITHNLGIVRRIADRVAVMQAGEIVEIRPHRPHLRRPHPPLHPEAPRRRAHRPPRPRPRRRPHRRRDRPPPRLVPDQARPPPQDRRPHQGGQRRHRRHPRRRDPRRRRRERLRQDHPRPRHHAPHLVGGPHRLPRPGHPGLEARPAPRAAPRHADGLPGPLRLALARACPSPRSSPRASPCTASATRPAASPPSSRRSASTPPPPSATRTSSPAASASASPSPAP